MYMSNKESDKKILDQISKEKNHAPSSKELYSRAVKHYTTLFSMSLTDLLQEADDEEEAGVRWKKRKLRQRLLIFRNYLYDNFKENTAKSYLGNVIAIYRHLEFELQPLPKYSTKGKEKEKPIEYKDLPDKLIIKEALRVGTLLMKSIILFISSSGTSRADCFNLTVQDYIDSTFEYHKLHTDDIYLVIEKLIELEKEGVIIIPRFNIQRQKTGVYYFTFCSPEFVNVVNSYLISRKGLLELDDPLFKISPRYFTTRFSEINDMLGLGYVGEYRRFRSHMLRKFHASNLKLGETGLSEEIVNELQGRVKPGVNQSYFFERVEDIKVKYIQAMPNILINWEIERVTVDSPEVKEIREENKQLREEMENIVEKSKEESQKLVNDMLQSYGLL